ncbi:hypothetical protein [Actinacidiphila epipremni]|jgi:hypothetical protein|uniref:Uncharacterized protein n=1 Tax=Actinacidiphila epipremni TaxID=2053013 RepID=A0ABX0ZV49_9ACTN|nr:hypothetical protein [Actinacidiphila epipremni]NJP47898.1 hypothetical protein [Actinacidiphila epipremni]
MDYVSAIVPPLVMAILFTCVIITMIKHQGGANKREDAAVDAAFAQAEAARRAAAQER